MEKLIYLAVIAGFIAGAITNLFGGGFWPVAIAVGLTAGAFQAGQVFAAR